MDDISTDISPISILYCLLLGVLLLPQFVCKHMFPLISFALLSNWVKDMSNRRHFLRKWNDREQVRPNGILNCNQCVKWKCKNLNLGNWQTAGILHSLLLFFFFGAVTPLLIHHHPKYENIKENFGRKIAFLLFLNYLW